MFCFWCGNIIEPSSLRFLFNSLSLHFLESILLLLLFLYIHFTSRTESLFTFSSLSLP